MIFQGASLFPWMTAYDNAAYGLRMRHVDKAEIAETVRLWLERIGLWRFRDLYPHQLSGGMRQRVSIVRAFANDPEILLMDEPFSALDEQNKVLLHEELLRIWEATKKTVVFITHSVEEAVTLGDRIMVMTASPGRAKAVIDVPSRADLGTARAAAKSRVRRPCRSHLGATSGRDASRTSVGKQQGIANDTSGARTVSSASPRLCCFCPPGSSRAISASSKSAFSHRPAASPIRSAFSLPQANSSRTRLRASGALRSECRSAALQPFCSA